jgi:MFS family permease
MRMVVMQNVAMALFFMGSYIVTMPLLIREVYGGNAESLSWVNAANSLGLFIAILILLRYGDIKRQGRALVLSQGIGALILALAGFNWGFKILVITLFFWGTCGGVAMTMSRTIMQEHAPEDQRGRMMAFYAFSFMGAGPLGALLSGYLVTWFGPLAALQLSSVAMFIVSIIVFIEGHLWNLGRTPRSSIHPNDH